MATVYRARDLKHERTVAIKVLRQELTEAIGADRFLREIRTTANLSHPHILPLFDSGEAAGLLYFVMPIVRGESLKDRLAREGQLPIEDAVQIAREVADALAYAHQEGVIHRDVKPANILLDQGHALLTDFGIAQAKAGAEETKLTRGGMSLGTPVYMSPEQISGGGRVDGRSDQYALGCVLFEMLAGHPPFTGADIQTVMRQHLAAETPKVTGARATVSTGLAKAVHRALAKSPADRFRTMSELEAALAGATLPFLAGIPMGRARAVVGAAIVVLVAAAAAIFVVPGLREAPLPVARAPELVSHRVVVMPINNRTGDSTLDVLADLATEQVGEAIQRLELVDPVALTMVQQYAERASSEGSADVVRAVADFFEAGLAVTGAIHAIGDSLRYRLEVIDVVKGRSIQPVVEDEPRDSPGKALGSLGGRVAGALARELDPYMEQGSQALSAPPLLESYRRYKLGYQAIDRYGLHQARDRRDLEEALEYFLAATELDTMFVLPLVIGSRVAVYLKDPRADSIIRFVELRRDLLDRRGQLQLDIQAANRKNDPHAALQAARDLVKVDPWGFSPVEYSAAARYVNRPREAIEALRTYDPDLEWRRDEAYGYWIALAEARHLLGEYEQELLDVQRGRGQYPSNVNLLTLEMGVLAALHRPGEVNSLLDQALALLPDPTGPMIDAALELRAHGHPEAALAAYQRSIDWLRDRPPEEANRVDRQQLLAWALLRAGRWGEAHAIFQALDSKRPDDLQLLSGMARSAARMGDTASARQISTRIAEMPWPEHSNEDCEQFYVRSILAALLGQPDEAMRLLREAFSRGKYFGIMLHREPDLESLHDREDWKELLRPKG